jgi:sortase (surface protein transpeptidase)
MKSIFKKKISKPPQASYTIRVGRENKGVIYWTKPSLLSLVLAAIALFFIVGAVIMLSVPFFPRVIYTIFPGMSNALAQILSRPPTTFGDILRESGEEEAEIYQPAVNASLPDKNMIFITKIGVSTEIIEESYANFENALRKGVWHVPEFGTPFARRYPTILVAHRFGYLEWSSQYRRQNSFYNLPKLEPGDKVEIIWEKRKYLFEITDKEESEEITNYTSDLILYTCKFLKSPNRIFLYARLLQPV